jgi:penicillin amidase
MNKLLMVAIATLGLNTAWAQDPIEAAGLSGEVSVYTDANGIPTIVGETETDVSFVQGYLHARDRFFQMDYLRRVGSGTLGELFGAAALENDITLRTLGLRRAAWSSYTELTGKELAWLKSYTDGVNFYLANNALPPEYAALELSLAEPWSAVDSLVIGKLLAFQLSFDSSLSDIENTIRLGTYQAVGEAAGLKISIFPCLSMDG